MYSQANRSNLTPLLVLSKYLFICLLLNLFSLAYGAFERHLHGSRATLVRLAFDTCTAHEPHLHGSKPT